MPEPSGQWIKYPATDAAIIFVHGILSDGDSCWRVENTYWPELLAAEDTHGAGIYVFSYRTGMFTAGYSLGDAVEALNAYLDLDCLFDLKRLVFVCHSMGGILVRQFLVARQSILIDKSIRIGVFLIASPSLGSDYANLLGALAKAFGNSQADALRFSDTNAWLNDLDRNFLNLKESNALDIEGKELVEDEFITLHKWIRRQVVRPFSGAKYFGNSLKIPGSNHFSIAKPTGRDSLQHRLLVQFIDKFLAAPDISSEIVQTRPLFRDQKFIRLDERRKAVEQMRLESERKSAEGQRLGDLSRQSTQRRLTRNAARFVGLFSLLAVVIAIVILGLKVYGPNTSVTPTVPVTSNNTASRSDIEAEVSKLPRLIGDLGITSGPIARNHDDVETLKRLGQRNIFEFSLGISNVPENVGPTQIRLRSVDTNFSRYTLDVFDGKQTIEKREKVVGEAVQFYMQGYGTPFEIVVFHVGDESVSGYLSIPVSRE